MLPTDIILLIRILVIFISTCDVLCKSHNRWPCGNVRDGERYKVIFGFAGENDDTDGYGGMVREVLSMGEEAMSGGSGDGGGRLACYRKHQMSWLLRL